MLSESVQRLARSLLQATVILTIIRRKIEIPHQRNSLYKKYVEVIFNREKEKSSIVHNHEYALLRLHERVGYELHCKMEHSRVEAIDRSTFRNYVLSVLEDYSAIDIGNKKFREVADEIIEAVTDRLCLLVGKGENQTDVDFVVQQYREYFAALYLSNHPDADPDRVFNALVQRGAYWAYVLQFYVAQANTNQQMCWVRDIPEQNDGEDPIEALVRRTRIYRAIFNVLPEFTLQRKSDIKSALETIFSLETRWTWLEQETVIGILKLIPSIDIFQTIRKIFGNLSLQDSTTLALELWLLLELSSYQSQELEELCSQIQTLLNQEDTQDIALPLAFQYDLKVNLSACNISKIEIGFDKFFYEHIRKSLHKGQIQLQNLVSFQPKEKKLELLFFMVCLWQWTDTQIPGLSQSLVKTLFPEEEASILGDSIRLKLFPYLYRQPLKSNLLKTLNKIIEGIENIQSEYLRAILGAVQNPTDNDLDNKVRELESQFSNKDIYYGWKASHILGPDPSDFHSVESWKKFKQEIANLSSTDSKWVTKSIDFKESKNLWICLFFHPDYWSLLIEEGLITENERDSILNTPLGKILSIPKLSIDIFSSVSSFANVSEKIPLYEILHVVLNILEKEGVERICQARGLEFVLYHPRIQQSVPLEYLEDLLRRAKNFSPLPSSWVSAILTLCINAPDIDIELLLDFWENSKSSHPRLRFFHKEKLSDEWNQILKKLISSNRTSALNLGIAIIACARPDKQIQDVLLVRLLAESTSYINNNDDTSFELYCFALLNLDPSLEGFSLWSNPQVINLMHKSPWILDRLSKRFGSAVDLKFRLDYQQLRKQFFIFITNRRDYPENISLAALESILKIDEVNLPALDSKTWQQNFDD